MINDIKLIKFKLCASVVDIFNKQKRFPKSKNKRIRKKWKKLFSEKETKPTQGLAVLGVDWGTSTMYAKVHPEYYEKVFKFTVDKYNSTSDVPDMMLVED